MQESKTKLEDVGELIHRQRTFFASGATKNIAFRLQLLTLLENALRDWQPKLERAIALDYGKSAFDVYLTEFSQIYSEIKVAKKTSGHGQNNAVYPPTSPICQGAATL